jgi:hypothetical protein
MRNQLFDPGDDRADVTEFAPQIAARGILVR